MSKNSQQMNSKQKIVFFITLIAVYVIFTLPVLYLSVLLIGKADIPIVLFFGVINVLFARKIFKKYPFFIIPIGFLISSASLCFAYLIAYVSEHYSNANFGFLSYIIVSILLWIAIIQNNWKIKNQRKVFLIISVLTLFFLTLSFGLKEIYPSKVEHRNLVSTEIKIVDKQKMPISGRTIEVRIHIQPLFGIRGTHKINKAITNENGIARIELSKSRNYTLDINTKENKSIDFEISSTDLKNKKSFIIEDK
ncbi:MAG: hypothetical protein ABI576_15560 [Flavobacterium sp.]